VIVGGVVVAFATRTVRRDMARVETAAAGQRSMGLP
jgi:ribosomal protein L29